MNFNEFLKYNSETGNLIWIKKPNHRCKSIAGTLNGNGYMQISFNKKRYLNHRVAWYLHYGVWPTGQIDHINGVKNDNKISNLRDVTQSQNQLNRKSHREKTVKYYYFDKSSNKYKVKYTINGKQKHLGAFINKNDAIEFIKTNIMLFTGEI